MAGGLVTKEELQRLTPWCGVTIAVLLFLYVEIWFEGVCTDPILSKDLGVDKAGSCFEFWFNRYQTFVGAIIALLAAIIAALTAWRAADRQVEKAQGQINAADKQLNEVRRQTLLISAQSAAVRAAELRKMIEAADRAVDLAVKFYDDWQLIYPLCQLTLEKLRDDTPKHALSLEEREARRTNVSSGILNEFELALENNLQIAEQIRADLYWFMWRHKRFDRYIRVITRNIRVTSIILKDIKAPWWLYGKEDIASIYAKNIRQMFSIEFWVDVDVEIASLPNAIRHEKDLLFEELRGTLTEVVNRFE